MLKAAADKITPKTVHKQESYGRSQSMKDKLEVLKNGTDLHKIRDKGTRGIRFYKRKFWLDMDNLLLRYSPHKDGKAMGLCTSGSQGDSYYNLTEISEVRVEYNTDLFNDISNKNVQNTKCRHLSPKTSFSLIFSPESNLHELDLIAEDMETRNLWVDSISHIVLLLRSMTNQKDYELYLKKQFKSADDNESGYLNFDEVKDLCRQLNIKMDKEDMLRLFDLANTNKGDINNKDKEQVLNEDEFVSFYYKLMEEANPAIIKEIFDKYATDNKQNETRLTRQNLQTFFSDEQKFDMLPEECSRIISQHETSEDKTSFTQEGFTHFLMFSELQDVMDPQEKLQVTEDMTQPLSHYWIASSHNTYLTGNQLTGESSIKGYIEALKRGCRCVELDCWDGDDGEPIIYHGYTLTTKIQFKDVVEACKKYAFEKSAYPLILSIENHCGIGQQEVMALHLKNILGSSLYVGEPDQSADKLPSPEDLTHKILIKAKRLPPSCNDDNDGDDVDEPDDPTDDERDDCKKVKVKIAKKLSDLVNYIHAVHFHGFENPESKYFHMSSFGESKTWNILEDPDKARQFVEYNTKQISRIYPGAKRQDSSNLKIIPPLTAGCQIVALNYQKDDRQNFLNSAWFSGNGGCGYRLKPEFLRNPALTYYPTKMNRLSKDKFESVTLHIKIISGQHIPKPGGDDDGEVVDPYVEVKIRGHVDDFTNEENHQETEYVKNNGFNPVWKEKNEFKFHIQVPELALLELKVKDHSTRKKDQHLGSFAIPVIYMKEGYRKAGLVDYSGKDLKPAALFLHVKKVYGI